MDGCYRLDLLVDSVVACAARGSSMLAVGALFSRLLLRIGGSKGRLLGEFSCRALVRHVGDTNIGMEDAVFDAGFLSVVTSLGAANAIYYFF